jgi:hypothetical protein
MRIVVYYSNGNNEEFYGDLSISKESILCITPQCGRGSPTFVPLTSILKYTIDR